MDAADSTAWYWAIGLIALAFGVALGFALNFFLGNGHSRAEQLEKELSDLKGEMESYRGQVTHHFKRTSELVQEMTDSYRSVYEHLATGSQQLCGDASSSPQLAAWPENARLVNESADSGAPQAETAGEPDAAAETPRPEAVSEPATAAETPSSDEYLGDVPHVPDLNPETEAAETDKRPA